ncbi:hypothetical protein PAHAL_9G269800 [Panicum hallii]|uniref:Uncharacterized protein n=1 Tax=Panicum hallii TaxID=206008 RepID=A0A2S3IMN7_9POAL|nr:hypothetical protein PAHAL_9G269800 [Panicum hallii]
MTCAASSDTCRGCISRGIQGTLLVQRQLTSFHYTIQKTRFFQMNNRIKLDGQCRITETDITKVHTDFAIIQPKSCPNTDQSDKTQGSMTIRHSDTVYCRKKHNHPVVPRR